MKNLCLGLLALVAMSNMCLANSNVKVEQAVEIFYPNKVLQTALNSIGNSGFKCFLDLRTYKEFEKSDNSTGYTINKLCVLSAREKVTVKFELSDASGAILPNKITFDYSL